MDKNLEFKKNGYLILKNCLSANEIADYRALAIKLCDEKALKVGHHSPNGAHDRQLYAQAFVENPELINPLLKKEIVDQVKEVFGDDYISFADFSISDNCHSPIWHADAQSHGFSTQYVYDKFFNIAKLGLYLQPDDDIYGGQLDIIPGSHLPSFLGTNFPITSNKRYGKVSKLQLIAMKIRHKFLKKISVNVNPGDVVIFHALLRHRASQPDWSKLEQINGYGIKDVPEDKRKFMLQWEVSANNEFAPVYATHQTYRGKKIGSGEFFEANLFDLNDYHESTKQLIKDNKINFKKYSDMIISLASNNLKSQSGTPIVFLNNEVNNEN